MGTRNLSYWTQNSYRSCENVLAHYIYISETVNQLKQTHTLLLKVLTKPHTHNLFFTRFLRQLLQVPGDRFNYARKVFDQIPNCKSQFLWTSLIRIHVSHAFFSESILLYAKMHQRGIFPYGFTFSSVLNACARMPAICEGKQIHTKTLKTGFLSNKIVQTSLLDMYAKCGFTVDARIVFDTMDDKDVITWTAMICGYSKTGVMDEAQRLFDIMEEHNVVSWTAMVAGYANCGDMKSAKELYEMMTERNSITYLAMIAGYGKCGEVSEARRIFDEMPEKDVKCWAAMVACYAHNGYAMESIEMYKVMREENVRVTEVAMVGAMTACSQLGDAEMAMTLAEHMEGGSCNSTLIVSNALIHMYAKCGDVEKAWTEFGRVKERDIVSYSTMITALADHGRSQAALDLFLRMRKEGIKCNQVTFIGVLNACSHGGLVEEGCKYFELMTRVYGMEPLAAHITCMVGLLGRARQLEKAYRLMLENEELCDAVTWGALLGACEIHGNAKMGEIAASHLFKLEPKCTGNYVQLANIYASISRWNDAEKVRKMIREQERIKSPGCCWISSREMHYTVPPC
ncbi:putative pentatricopeptide repeat-containing protein At5g37570 [Tripterygium wilfordii]|uniref:putative pentatricopeptide repeat-containing protein At5g37570 n=1 Tax=Tripterygium wilfordii TaxID=458696 RepID=UPI0018F857B5|nr:putative pentatricopeptide repeat-containing protein At5g37570 [Tripterygium wilfordii]